MNRVNRAPNIKIARRTMMQQFLTEIDDGMTTLGRLWCKYIVIGKRSSEAKTRSEDRHHPDSARSIEFGPTQ